MSLKTKISFNGVNVSKTVLFKYCILNMLTILIKKCILLIIIFEKNYFILFLIYVEKKVSCRVNINL